MSTVNLAGPREMVRRRILRKQALRRGLAVQSRNPRAAMRRHLARMQARGASPAAMGSWLSAWIKKRRKKGVDLNLKVGKGTLSYSTPATIDPATGLPQKTGPIEWVKRNPAIVAGVAGGGLLLTMVLLKKRKGGKK